MVPKDTLAMRVTTNSATPSAVARTLPARGDVRSSPCVERSTNALLTLHPYKANQAGRCRSEIEELP